MQSRLLLWALIVMTVVLAAWVVTLNLQPEEEGVNTSPPHAIDQNE